MQQEITFLHQLRSAFILTFQPTVVRIQKQEFGHNTQNNVLFCFDLVFVFLFFLFLIFSNKGTEVSHFQNIILDSFNDKRPLFFQKKAFLFGLYFYKGSPLSVFVRNNIKSRKKRHPTCDSYRLTTYLFRQVKGNRFPIFS